MKRCIRSNAAIVIFLYMVTVSSCKNDEPCIATSVANAGADQIVNDVSTTLQATAPTKGRGVWSIVAGEGGAIAEPRNPVSAFTGIIGVTYELKWTISGCTVSEDVVSIMLGCNDVANAGVDQVIEVVSTSLAATSPQVGIGTWSIVSGEGGIISNGANNPTATFSGLVGTAYTLRWTLTCSGVFDDVIITISSTATITRRIKKIYLNGVLQSEYFYNAMGNRDYVLSTFNSQQYRNNYVYNSNGALQRIENIAPDEVQFTNYYYKPDGMLDYFVLNEGSAGDQQKTKVFFENGRMSQLIFLSTIPELETGKAVYEYNDNVVTTNNYSYPYSSGPTYTRITTYDTDHPRVGAVDAASVTGITYYLPWELVLSQEVYINSVYSPSSSNTCSYEFDAHNRVVKSTITSANGTTHVYTYEY